jgi:hypothetical protein
VALFAASWLGVRWARRRHRRAFFGLAGGVIGMLLVVAPLTQRCTQLVGHFCPGACNGPMNVALGHAPRVAGLHFAPLPGERTAGMNWWFPPARGQHGYQGFAEVPGSQYDTSRVLSWVKDRFVEDPGEFAVQSLGNALDLFGSTFWPDDYAPLPVRRATVLKQVFFLFVLIPGMAMWGLNVRRMLQGRDIGCTEAFFTSTIAGVFLLAAASLGEARYRVPFDAVFVLLAARAFAGKGRAPSATPPRPWVWRSLSVTGVALAIGAALLVATADTQLRLAARLSAAVPTRHLAPSSAGSLPLSRLGTPRPDGTPWDAPDNFSFRCTPECAELKIDLEGERRSPSIEVSADHNDRYEVVFYRHGHSVGRTAWGYVDGPDGLKVVRSAVPLSAQTAGYDTLGVRPLYGDGKYSIGHVHLIEAP